MPEKREKKVQKIYKFIKEKQLSLTLLSKYMGYTKTYVTHVLKGDSALSNRFANLLEIAIRKFIDDLSQEVDEILKE